jgi:hypothetical protein
LERAGFVDRDSGKNVSSPHEHDHDHGAFTILL